MRLREHPAIGEGRTDVFPADPRQLSIMPDYNVRDLTTPEAREELDDLKAQVKQHGVRTALVVRFDGQKIWIVEGHRRHKVAMELIAEFDASGGAEGRNIDFVPIKQETPGTSEIDRDFGLETSNSGARLKPLELANLIYRLHTQRGLPLEAIATGLGKTLIVVRNHLAMRGMPEEVKQHVKDGDVSASLAMKMLKEEPDKVAEMIKANQEENRRLGVGARMKHKVTPKTLSRDRPKATAAAIQPSTAIDATPSAKMPSAVLPQHYEWDKIATAADAELTTPTGSETTLASKSSSGVGAAAAQELHSPVASASSPAHLDLLPVLIELTKHAKHVLDVNQSDEAPGGFWTRELVEAVLVAERMIAQCGGNGGDPYAQFAAAIDQTKALAEGKHV